MADAAAFDLIDDGGAPVADGDWPGLPGSATYAIDVVEAPSDLRGALTRLLFKVAVVSDLSAARDLVTQLPDVVAVTRDGDLFGAHFAAGGSHSVPSLIEVQAAVDEATDALQRAVHDVERLIASAQAEIDAELATDVLIIEDEAIISADIESLVRESMNWTASDGVQVQIEVDDNPPHGDLDFNDMVVFCEPLEGDFVSPHAVQQRPDLTIPEELIGH